MLKKGVANVAIFLVPFLWHGKSDGEEREVADGANQFVSL